jgi:integrase
MTTRPKRSNGDGSIYFDKSRSRWVATVTLPDGPRRKRTAVKKSEAQSLLRKMLADLQVDGGICDQKSRFGDLSSLWSVKVLEARHMAPTTRDAKRWALDRINRELSTTRLVDLTPDRIEDALGTMAADGLSRQSLIKIRSVLNQVCKFGERRDLLRRNPVPMVELPPGLAMGSEGRALTAAQANVLLEVASTHRLNAMWLVMLMLGLRPGEAAALHWANVDMGQGKLHVRQNLRKIDRVFEVSDELKTKKSRRSLGMPSRLIDALAEHRLAQASERDAAGEAWDTRWPDLVFTSISGSPLDASNLRRTFKELTVSAGLGEWAPNHLRHSCVSLLSALGAPLEEIADLAGHDGTRMTSGVYRHGVTPSVDVAVDRMEQLFGDLAADCER